MFGLGAQELILILVILMIIFGAKKLPDLARGMGKSLKELKGVKKEIEDDLS